MGGCKRNILYNFPPVFQYYSKTIVKSKVVRIFGKVVEFWNYLRD